MLVADHGPSNDLSVIDVSTMTVTIRRTRRAITGMGIYSALVANCRRVFHRELESHFAPVAAEHRAQRRHRNGTYPVRLSAGLAGVVRPASHLGRSGART